MASAWFLKNLLANLLLPPTNALLLLALAGIFRRRRWAFWLALLGGVALLAQSLPPVASALIATLEERAGPVLSDPGDAQAIVVLGSGLSIAAQEYGGDTANDRSLIRLRYAATLARRYQLPLLVSGGKPRNATRAEADVIGDILEKEFAVPVRWRETRSRDTAENAIFSAQILQAAGIRRVVLVTQAFHMPRARRLFAAAGFDVVPAPT
ncbi:MAG: YdcF family protein, partial [Propionivibrio sp.]